MEVKPAVVERRRPVYLWIAAFALALFLAPGFNGFETPQDLHVEQAVYHARLGLDSAPSTILYNRGPNRLYYEVHEPGSLLLALPIGYAAWLGARASHLPFKRLYEMGLAVLGCALFATTFLVALALLRDLGVATRHSEWNSWPYCWAASISSTRAYRRT